MNSGVFGRGIGTAILSLFALVVLLATDCHGTRADDTDAVTTVTIAALPSQTIKGWGCIPSEQEGGNVVAGTRGSLSDRRAIQDAVYSLGFTIIRYDLQSTYGLPNSQLNTSNSGGIGDLVAQLEIAKAHGVNQYLLCVWSPPPFMFSTGSREMSAVREDHPQQLRAFRAYLDKSVSRPRN